MEISLTPKGSENMNKGIDRLWNPEDWDFKVVFFFKKKSQNILFVNEMILYIKEPNISPGNF